MVRKKLVPVDPDIGTKEPKEVTIPENLDHPMLRDWRPTEDQIYMQFREKDVIADFSGMFHGMHYTDLETFRILKKHFIDRMNDVVFHINYFINYYDTDKQYFTALMTIKYLVDSNPNMKQSVFRDYIINRIATDEFVENILHMVNYLYRININTDEEDKYKSTPKITNSDAKSIIALSFAIRTILPLCVHYSNISSQMVQSRQYIGCFNNIFMALLQRFEAHGAKCYIALCEFVEYRLKKYYNQDSLIWDMKKQLYGTTFETEYQNLINEVIFVKSLYKISYDRSVVSYIDGVVKKSYEHFKYENFKNKPVEIEADTGGDSDDYLTHSESIEMSIYKIDESNQIINEVNNEEVMPQIIDRFGIVIDDEELNFYLHHVKFNKVIDNLVNSFFSKYFHNSQSTVTLSFRDSVTLAVIMKKFLQSKGMTILPQFCTADIRGKYKDSIIRNTKFLEKKNESPEYQEILRTKYKYAREINLKGSSKKDDHGDLMDELLSVIINSEFVFVDVDPAINGMPATDIPLDVIMHEYNIFQAII